MPRIRADILADCAGRRTARDCRACPEYDRCDRCERRVCAYVAVHVYCGGVDDELICRPCARHMGFNEQEIATQAIDPLTGLSGAAVHDVAHETDPPQRKRMCDAAD